MDFDGNKYDASNALVLPSKKSEPKVSKVEIRKKKKLSKKQLKKLQNVVQRRQKKASVSLLFTFFFFFFFKSSLSAFDYLFFLEESNFRGICKASNHTRRTRFDDIDLRDTNERTQKVQA